ncbi:hypothetical protein AMAG_08134 [Allomyces macrogynus ATCC 38327]|uniref:SH3 domain-containing protein n=1 Tax=Allomyces macrogynus (strain ATCC 38327) TaxID=578462 RepID=A0A0L0SKD9_ALLM3|nr:hypothetical protein AMAG_08134 [Allomyces macrogynus ATCC 38327]|eukprot:KNE62961.1 hypothetical protein AMAG_08134 [Allomyces macrogynus ATCC 38327]
MKRPVPLTSQPQDGLLLSPPSPTPTTVFIHHPPRKQDSPLPAPAAACSQRRAAPAAGPVPPTFEIDETTTAATCCNPRLDDTTPSTARTTAPRQDKRIFVPPRPQTYLARASTMPAARSPRRAAPLAAAMAAVLAVAVLLLAQAPAAVVAASDSLVNGTCLQIQKDFRFCTGLEGQYIDMSLTTNQTSAAVLLARSNASDTRPASDVFQENFAVFLNNRETRMPNGVDATYANLFMSRFGCPGYTHYYRRYLISMWCIDLVSASRTKCPANVAQFQPLCRDTCNIYARSTIESFTNATQCPPTGTNVTPADRDKAANETSKTCERDIFNGLMPLCVSGDTIERSTCGYIPLARVCDPAVCLLSGDLCRANGAATAPSSTDAATAAAASDSSNKASALVPIILGVGFGVFFLAVIAFYLWRRRVSQRHVKARKEEAALNRGSRSGTLSPGGADDPYGSGPGSNLRSPYSETGPLASPTSPYGGSQVGGAYGGSQVGGQPGQGQQAKYGAFWAVDNGAPRSPTRPDMPPMPPSPTSPLPPPPGSAVGAASEVSGVSRKATKRISSLIVDRNVPTADLLRASLALDEAELARVGLGPVPPLPSNAKTLPAMPAMAAVDAAGSATAPVADYDRPKQHRVLKPYTPVLQDELELALGDILSVSQIYDDGWAFALNLATGQVGVAPISFLAPMPKDTPVHLVPSRPSQYGDPGKLAELKRVAAAAAAEEEAQQRQRQQQQQAQQQAQQYASPAPPQQQTQYAPRPGPLTPITEVSERSTNGPWSPVSAKSPTDLAPDAASSPSLARNIDHSRVSVSAARQVARDTVFVGDDGESDDDEPAPAARAAEPSSSPPKPAAVMSATVSTAPSDPVTDAKVDITTLMEVLARIAASGQEPGLLADLHLDPHDLTARTPKARQSIMKQIELEKMHRASRDGGSDVGSSVAATDENEADEMPSDAKNNRFSFSALLDVLEDADDDVDPDTLANTLLNCYNMNSKAPSPVPRPTPSPGLSSSAGTPRASPAPPSAPAPVPAPAASSVLSSSPAGPASSASRLAQAQQMQRPPMPPAPASVTTATTDMRPLSTLSDLDRLENMLNQEEEMLRQLRM